MNTCKEKSGCEMVPGFGLGEKIVIRTAFILGIGIGTYGMWPTSPGLATGYVLFSVFWYGMLMRYTVCTRCPHLKVAGDCLFMPAWLTRRLISDRSGPLTPFQHLIVLIAVGGTALIPLYWLWGQPTVLGAYVLVSGGWMLGLYLRICPRCQVVECPLRKYAQRVDG